MHTQYTYNWFSSHRVYNVQIFVLTLWRQSFPVYSTLGTKLYTEDYISVQQKDYTIHKLRYTLFTGGWKSNTEMHGMWGHTQCLAPARPQQSDDVQRHTPQRPTHHYPNTNTGGADLSLHLGATRHCLGTVISVLRWLILGQFDFSYKAIW